LAKSKEIYRLVDAARGTVVAERVRRARNAWERLVGLVGRKSLEPGEGLWLDPCNGVHTFGMRFSIDLLVLDEDGRVLRIVTRLSPWRVSAPSRGGKSVVELPAFTLGKSALAAGDLVRWERSE
jgi:uncharacterized protein